MNCEGCIFLFYDEDSCYTCSMPLDEDEMSRFVQYKECPYFRAGDEYTIVKKQI